MEPFLLAFILRRLLWAIPVLFFVALVSFFLMHQAPGGPFDKDNNKKQVDGATLKALNSRFGLDKPQYVNPGAVGEQWRQGQRNPLSLGRAQAEFVDRLSQPVFRNDRGRGAVIRHRPAGDHHLRHHTAMDLDLEQ